jgi:hypothetical protein
MTEQPIDADLAQRVLSLRRAGVKFDAIGANLNITTEEAAALCEAALANANPEVSAALEADRLDRLHMAVWPAAQGGDLKAVDAVLKISEQRTKVLADPRPNEHRLRLAFDASVETSTQVTDVDQALVAAGRAIADQVDVVIATGGGYELTKALYLVPHMTNVLRELLATPASRQAAGLSAQPPKEGKLAQLRAVQGKGRTG